MPAWVTSVRAETLEDVAFMSGAALSNLHVYSTATMSPRVCCGSGSRCSQRRLVSRFWVGRNEPRACATPCTFCAQRTCPDRQERPISPGGSRLSGQFRSGLWAGLCRRIRQRRSREGLTRGRARRWPEQRWCWKQFCRQYQERERRRLSSPIQPSLRRLAGKAPWLSNERPHK